MFCVVSWDSLCPTIFPWVDPFLDILPASLIVLYSDGEVVEPKGDRSKRKFNFSTIDMQVDVIVAFAWIWQ